MGIFVEKEESKAAEVNTGRPKTSKIESFATIVNASDAVFVATEFFVHESIFFMFSCLFFLKSLAIVSFITSVEN